MIAPASRKPSLLCQLLGHKHDPEHYGRVILEGVDGLGVQHARVMAECDRCEAKFNLTKIHLP